MGRNWARLGGENSRSKGFWGRWQANGCFRRSRGVWLLGKLRQGAPGASGQKKAAPGQNEPGRNHPELEFML